MNINRTRDGEAPHSPSSESSDHDTINAAAALPAGAALGGAGAYAATHNESDRDDEDPYRLRGIPTARTPAATYDDDAERYMASAPQQQYQSQPAFQQQESVPNQSFFLPGQQADPAYQQPASTYQQQQPVSTYQQQPMPSYQQQPASTYQPQQPIQPAQAQYESPEPFPRDHERNNSSYGDWMAPAAVGAGAGVAGTAAYNHYNHANEPEPQAQQPLQQQETLPIQDPLVAQDPLGAQDPTSSTRDFSAAAETPAADNTFTPTPATVSEPAPTANANANGTFLSYPSTADTSTGLTGSSGSPVARLDGGLGGLEAKGAHETGRIIPIVRHDTDVSVSQLHVPGEFK